MSCADRRFFLNGARQKKQRQSFLFWMLRYWFQIFVVIPFLSRKWKGSKFNRSRGILLIHVYQWQLCLFCKSDFYPSFVSGGGHVSVCESNFARFWLLDSLEECYVVEDNLGCLPTNDNNLGVFIIFPSTWTYPIYRNAILRHDSCWHQQCIAVSAARLINIPCFLFALLCIEQLSCPSLSQYFIMRPMPCSLRLLILLSLALSVVPPLFQTGV